MHSHEAGLLFLSILRIFALSTLAIFVNSSAFAQPDINGETGYINMPSGRIDPDGTFRMGYSFAEPYTSFWSSISFLPRVELNARYVRIMSGAIGGTNPSWQGYGDYKDKVFSGKIILLDEDRFIPSLAIGSNDMLGTRLFKAQYLAASKRFGALDATIGAGVGRIDGTFAGARYAPEAWEGIGLAAEYDANNYRQDLYARQTGVNQRKKGIGLALEYRRGWLGSQLSYRDGMFGINLYAAIPFEKREFIPKIDEPAADTEIAVHPTLEQWNADPQYRQVLFNRLLKQDFKNIRINVTDGVAEATLGNTRISLASRAVGRAARSILLCAPQGVREVKINYAISDMPFATYTFEDADKFQRYFNGLESRKQLASSVTIDYAEPQPASAKTGQRMDISGGYSSTHLDSNDGDIVSFRSESSSLDKSRVAPGIGIYFNDPSGAVRFETFINASYEKQVHDGLLFKTALQLTLWQNVSGVRQPSNSLLPHVRTDVADYKKNGNLKLSQFLLNKFYHPRQRLYSRSSIGMYEEMFGGAGGQVLYYPGRAPWAIDLSADALRQRDIEGWFKFRSYSTVTMLASLHYRFQAAGVTATIRAGRFLAGDTGGRIEMKRRYRSGFEVGAWYTVTNGNDITSPGTPSHPYNDKGIFISIPLSTMLTKDTQTTPKISISPWTRDVGQMVISPGDLYDLLEPAYINMHDRDGLQYLGDLDDSYE